MNPIGSNSIVARLYGGIQSRNTNQAVDTQKSRESETRATEFRLPENATPRGDWVLSENANPQSFDQNAQRGSYLNIVV